MLSSYAEHLKRLREQYTLPQTNTNTVSSSGGHMDVPSSAASSQPRQPSVEVAPSGSRFGVPLTVLQDAPPTKSSAASDHPRQRFSVAEATAAKNTSTTPPSSFETERSQLLRLLQQDTAAVSHEASSQPSVSAVHRASQQHHAPHTIDVNTPSPSQPHASVAALGASVHHARYREILAEVEQLSATIAQLHRERSESEQEWSRRLREVRQESDAASSKSLEMELAVEELTAEVADLNTQLTAAKRDAQKYQRDSEMYRQQVLLHTEQQQQLAQLMQDTDSREKLMAAQEQCMKELETRCDATAAAAKDYEQRLFRLQRVHQAEIESASLRESQWREMLSTIAGALLLFGKEVEDGCSQLIRRASPASGGQSPRASSQFTDDGSKSPLRTLDADLSHRTQGHADSGAGLQHALERLEAAMGTTETPAGQQSPFHRCRDQFSEVVQRKLRHFNRAMAAIQKLTDEAQLQASTSSDHRRQYEELIGRAEAQNAALQRENAALRKEKQELVAAADSLRITVAELKQRLAEFIDDAEKREESNAKHTESLRQLIEGADLDLHRQRMRVNELEALNTRIIAQRAMSEEEAKSTIQQLRQSVAVKDGQVAKLRVESEQLRARVVQLEMHSLASDVGDEHRSVSMLQADQSTTTGSVVGASFLRQQNQQLAQHIEALQRRMERMKEEKDTAVSALEKQRGVVRQQEDILEMMMYRGGGTSSSATGSGNNSVVAR